MRRKKYHAEQYELSFSQDTQGRILEMYVKDAFLWRVYYSNGTTETSTFVYTSCQRRPVEMMFEFESRYPGNKALKAEFCGRTK